MAAGPSGHGCDRFECAAALQHDLWGDALPPGGEPWRRVARDVCELDDDHGARAGLVVQGDALSLAVLRQLLGHLPHDAPLWDAVPAGLLERMHRQLAAGPPDHD